MNEVDYNVYNEVLKERFGIDWFHMSSIFSSLDNAPGVYPDVALLLSVLISSEPVSKTLELGSGSSTVFISNASTKASKEYLTIEAEERWASKTSDLLDAFSLPKKIMFCISENGETVLHNPQFIPDLVWIDGGVLFTPSGGQDRVRTCELYWSYLKDAVLLFDDAQSYTDMGVEIRAFLSSNERDSDYVFNPTGRGDRHILISIPKDKKDILDIIKTCELLGDGNVSQL